MPCSFGMTSSFPDLIRVTRLTQDPAGVHFTAVFRRRVIYGGNGELTRKPFLTPSLRVGR